MPTEFRQTLYFEKYLFMIIGRFFIIFVPQGASLKELVGFAQMGWGRGGNKAGTDYKAGRCVPTGMSPQRNKEMASQRGKRHGLG